MSLRMAYRMVMELVAYGVFDGVSWLPLLWYAWHAVLMGVEACGVQGVGCRACPSPTALARCHMSNPLNSDVTGVPRS